MPRIAAGLLMYRIRDGVVEVLLAHPGGPYFQNKDDGAWTIPKGEPNAGEAYGGADDLLAVAIREFAEETGVAPSGNYLPLKPIKQKGGKIVYAWAFQGDCDTAACRSNLFTMEWPPKSGRQVDFPEMDRAEFFDLRTAREKIKQAQAPLLVELEEWLRDAPRPRRSANRTRTTEPRPRNAEH
jgi:predicted NUDIX family NTP pyrophosphohydrolase